MKVKILHWTGIVACIVLVIACFMPWAYFADPNIPDESARTFTGFYSFRNQYGKPGKFLTIIAILSLVLMLLPKIWAKRTNLFVVALGVGYAIKSFILYVACYNAYCPERKAGIYLVLVAVAVMMISAVFPSLALNETTDTTNPETTD